MNIDVEREKKMTCEMAPRAVWTRLLLTICFIYGAVLLALQLSLRPATHLQSPALLEFSLKEHSGRSRQHARSLNQPADSGSNNSKSQQQPAIQGAKHPMTGHNTTIYVRHLHANSVLMRRLKETKQYLAAKVKEVSVLPPSGKPQPTGNLAYKVNFHKLHDDFYVYSAILDTRSRDSSMIRIFALCPSFEADLSWKAFCHVNALRETVSENYQKDIQGNLKAEDKFPPLSIQAEKYAMCENHGKKYGGWILSCPAPRGFNASTISISLTLKSYEGTTDTPKLNLPLKRVGERGQTAALNTLTRQLHMKSKKDGSRPRSKSEESLSSLDNNDIIKYRKGTAKSYEAVKQGYKAGPTPSPRIPKDDDVIGVCVPPLHGNVDITRIVNFVEMTRILGARQVFLYINDISPDMRQLLEEYVRLDSTFLRTIDWKIPVVETEFKHATPSDSTSLPASEIIWNGGQLLAIQHCLYANMDDFHWLLFMDVDEMLFPRNAFTWDELFRHTTSQATLKETEKVPGKRNSPKVAGLVFESALFHPDPQSQAIYSIDYFQKLSRPRQTDKARTKLAVRPEAVFEMGIHHLSKEFVEGSMTVHVSPREALVHHYRDGGESWDQAAYYSYFTEEMALFYDKSALKYETLLTETSQTVMNALGKIMMARRRKGET